MAGGETNNKWRQFIRRWSDWGRGGYKDLLSSGNTTMHILPLKYGGIVYGAFDPAFGAFNASGRRIFYKGPAIADYRDNSQGFLVSWDGSTVRFGYEQSGKNPAVFSISDRSLKPDNGAGRSGLSPPITTFAGLSITGWKDTTTPKLNGAPLKLGRYDMSRSLAIAPDGKSFLLGTEWSLRLFDNKGKEKWNMGVR